MYSIYIYSEHERTLKLVDKRIKNFQSHDFSCLHTDDFYKEYKHLLYIRFKALELMQNLVTNYPYWIDEA